MATLVRSHPSFWLHLLHGQRDRKIKTKAKSRIRNILSLQAERVSERRRKEDSPAENIYDTPKTSSVKWKEDLAAAYDIVSKGSRNGVVSAVNLQLVPADGEDSETQQVD